MKPRKVKAGDKFVGWFYSSWDEQAPVEITFVVHWRHDGGWFCEGVETSEFDDWLTKFKNLTALSQ